MQPIGNALSNTLSGVIHDFFAKFARGASHLLGSAWAFLVAAGIVLTWAAAGPFLGFSQAWQLFINTGTTIVTFLMVFIIQNTQNRDARAIHVKLDELIHVVGEAHDDVVDIEDAPEEELQQREEEFVGVRQRAVNSSAGR